MQRNPSSHKGENGKVAVIGGSLHQHGAPLFSALAAEASGVDLIYVCNPLLHHEAAMEQSLNFQVYCFQGNDLSKNDINGILELLATMDSAVIGPGLARTKESLEATINIVSEASCPLVCDATALQPETWKLAQGKTVVLTPHLGELERMGIDQKNLPKLTQGSSITVLVKSETDTVYANGNMQEIKGGNAGLTVGGTGDALAGLIAGLVAQGRAPFDACIMASTIIKRAGSLLSQEFGYSYTTRNVITKIPHLLATLS
jgi:NAD(P)H-hydrate epimerase